MQDFSHQLTPPPQSWTNRTWKWRFPKESFFGGLSFSGFHVKLFRGVPHMMQTKFIESIEQTYEGRNLISHLLPLNPNFCTLGFWGSDSDPIPLVMLSFSTLKAILTNKKGTFISQQIPPKFHFQNAYTPLKIYGWNLRNSTPGNFRNIIWTKPPSFSGSSCSSFRGVPFGTWKFIQIGGWKLIWNSSEPSTFLGFAEVLGQQNHQLVVSSMVIFHPIGSNPPKNHRKKTTQQKRKPYAA